MADNTTKLIITAEAGQAISSLQNLQTSLGKLGGAMGAVTAMAPSLAGALSVGGFIAWQKHIIDTADGLNDMSQRVGMSVKELAGYNLAAQQSGTSLETLAKGVKGLAGFMVEHADLLKQAGITATDSSGAIKQLADVFKYMPDGVEKTTLATKLFGKAGMEMIPMLNMGSAGLEKAAQRSEKYAEIMGKLAPQADEFNDQLADLSAMSAGLGNSIASDLLPSMNNIVRAMIEAKKEGGLLKAVFVGLGGIAFEAFKPAEDTVESLSKKLEAAQKNLSARQAEQAKSAGGWLNNLAGASGINSAKVEVDSLTVSLKKLTEARQKDQEEQQRTQGDKKAAEDVAAAEAKKRAQTLLGIKATKELSTETASAYDSLVKSLKQKLAVEQAESASGQKLNESDKLRAEMGAKLAEVYGKLTPAQQKFAQGLIENVVSLKQHNDMMETASKLLEDAAKGYQDYLEGINKDTTSMVESTQQIRDHNIELIGGKEALAALIAKRLDDAIAIKEQDLARAESGDALSKETEELRKHVAALKDKRAAMGESVAAEQFRKQADEWKKFTDDIERSLTDSLMHGFEKGGKSGGQQFIDSIRNMLKTAAFKIAVQAIVNPIMGAAGSALGMPGASGQGGGAGGLIQTGSSLNTLINGGSSAGSIGAYGTFANSGVGSALRLSEEVMMMNESTGLLEASTVLTESGVAMSGAMSSLAAAAPYVAAAVVIANAIGLFGKGGGPQQGQYGHINAQGYKAGFTMSGGDTLGNKALTESAFSQVNALAEAFGKKLTGVMVDQGYKLDPQGSSQGLAYRKIVIGGKELTSGGTTFGKDDAASAAGYLGKLHTDELQELIKQLADPKLSAAADALMANFGELENSLPAYLTSQAAQKAMSESLMTSEQKTAAASADLNAHFEALGISVPSSSDALRGLIDGLDLTTKHDQDLLASLNSLGPAFLSIDAASKATQAALAQQMGDVEKQINTFDISPLTKSLIDISTATANAIEQATKLSATEADLTRIRELGTKQAKALLDSQASSAYIDLLNATGKKKEALEYDLSGAKSAYESGLSALAAANNISVDTIKQMIADAGSLDAAAAKYFSSMGSADQARTIEIVKAATRVANLQTQLDGLTTPSASLNPVTGAPETSAPSTIDTAARDAIASQHKELQDRLDALTMTSAQLLERQRAALDESNRALFDQVQAATVAKQAETDLAARRQAIANEHKNLQDQLDSLTMTSAELLNKQRNALDESNRALFDQVQAATVANKAQLDYQNTIATARNNLATAYKRESSELQATIEKFSNFAKTLREFRDSLMTGSLSTLSPEQKYAAESTKFKDISSRAQLGDITAIGQMQSESQAFLEASRNYYASSERYAADFNSVRDALGRTADVSERQSGIAQGQLDALTKMVSPLTSVSETVLSVNDAIAALNSAQLTTVPKFAAGGFHRGGLRLVGEHGPEIESTGPARIYSASETRRMLSGGEDLSPLLRDVIVELRALVSQGGVVATATVSKLEAVADKLDGTKRAIRQQVAA